MFARKSIPVLAVLAVMIAAPLAHAATAATSANPPAASHEVKVPETAKAPAAKHAAMHRLDLNTATRDELARQPGIGETVAEKIIAARPFQSKSELVSKGIVTKAEFGKLAPHVFARPATRPAATARPVTRPATKPAK